VLVNLVDLLWRQQLACVAVVAGLPSGLSLSALPLLSRRAVRRIRRRGLVRIRGVLAQSTFQLLDLGCLLLHGLH
jgi:hypothetical protein